MSARRRTNVEALLRQRIPHFREYYDLLTYEASPIGGYRLTPGQRLPHVSINDHGYRGAAFTEREEVLLLGDSVTFGVGAASDDERFPNFLAAALGTTVADASMRAYRVCQHYAQLPSLLPGLPRLRTVVVWCGYADLLFWATTGGRIDGVFDFPRKYARTPRTVIRGLTHRVRALGARIRPHPSAPIAPGSDTLEALIAHVRLYLRAIRDVCTGRRIDTVVLIQPFVRNRPSDPELIHLLDYYDGSTRTKCGISWYEAAPTFVTRLAEGLGVDGVVSIDCQLFALESDFVDQVHLRRGAHERIAKEVAARL